MKSSHDLVGLSFGDLTVISREANDCHHHVRWLCHCSCNEFTVVRADRLIGGNARSCGHLIGVVHGMATTPTYKSWKSMIQRCTNPNDSGFSNYGGRGIVVCPQWKDFTIFYRDMGVRPGGRSLDRIDNDGAYDVSNCRWATRLEQNNNKRPYRKKSKVT